MIESESTSAAAKTHRKMPRAAWGILFVAVVVRWGLQVLKVENLTTDPDAYVRLSESLAAGNGFSIEGSQLPTAFRPPLFPILLAVPQMLGLSAIFSVAIVQLVSSILLLIATWKISNLIGLSQGFALLALVTVALDPLLLLYSTIPMTEVPAAAFLAWASVYTLATWQAVSAGNLRSAVKSGILAGAYFGFGGLCRPILFVACAATSVVLFFAALLVRQVPRQDNLTSNVVKNIIAVCLPAIAAGVVLSPWVIRNAVQLGHFVPATSHGGYTLLLGNNPVFYSEVVNAAGQPRWEGKSLNQWNEGLARDMKRDGIQPADELGRDRWMYARAKSNIASDRTSFWKACRLRLRRLAALVPAASDGIPSVVKWSIGTFYAIVALGLLLQLCSMFRFSSGDRPASLLLWSLVVAFVVIHSVYWTNTRMRAPLMPVLIVLAAMGYQFVVAMLNKRGLMKTRREEHSGEVTQAEDHS